jgi:hypothetical protein
MSRSAGNLVVQHRSKGTAMGTFDEFFVMRTFGDVSPDDIRAAERCHQVIQNYRAEGSVSVIAIHTTTSLPSDETRRAMLEAMRLAIPKTLSISIVVLGDGFWASAIRGVFTTLGLFTHAPYPRQVFCDEEEAVDWAIGSIGESPVKYRAALLDGLSQLKPAATSPPPRTSKLSPGSSKLPPSSKRRTG